MEIQVVFCQVGKLSWFVDAVKASSRKNLGCFCTEGEASAFADKLREELA